MEPKDKPSASLRDALKDSNQKISDLEHELHRRDDEIQNLKDAQKKAASEDASQLKQRDKHIEFLEIQINTVAEEKTTLEKELRAAKEQRDRSADMLVQSNGMLTKLDNTRQTEHLQVQHLNGQFAQLKKDFEAQQKKLDALASFCRDTHAEKEAISRKASEYMEENEGLKNEMSALLERSQEQIEEIGELRRQNEELQAATHHNGSEDGGRSLGDELTGAGDDYGKDEEELEIGQIGAIVTQDGGTQTDSPQHTSTKSGPDAPPSTYIDARSGPDATLQTRDGTTQTEFAQHEGSKVATFKNQRLSSPWLVAILAVLLALSTSLFAFYHTLRRQRRASAVARSQRFIPSWGHYPAECSFWGASGWGG